MADVQRISSEKLDLLLRQRGINLTERRLRQLADENFFPPPVRGEFEFLATLLGLIQYYYKLREKQGGGLAQEKHRIAIADRKIREVEAAEVEGRVEDISEVERSRVALVMHLRGRLLGIPAKLAPRIAGFTTSAQIQSALESEINSILDALSEPIFVARPDPVAENGASEQ